jgi:hypothetical protein
VIRQIKTYLATVGVTDNAQDNTSVYEKAVQARDAVEAASKVRLGKREYVSEVRLAPDQPRVITVGAMTPVVVAAGPVSPSLKELAGIAERGIEALDAHIAKDVAELTEDAELAPRPGDEPVADEAFEHPPVGGLDKIDPVDFRNFV